MIITADIVISCIKDYNSYLQTSEELLKSGHIDEYTYSYTNTINNTKYIVEYDADHDYNYVHILKFYFSSKLFSKFYIFFKYGDNICYGEDPKSIFIENVQDLCTEEQLFQKTLVSKYANHFSADEYKVLTEVCNYTRKTLEMVTADE